MNYGNNYGNERTTSRRYRSNVELLKPDGEHLRRVPGDLAAHLVNTGVASIHTANGTVRAVKLTATIESHAERIGSPTPPHATSYGTRFVVREKLDTGSVVWQFHRRSFDP